MTKRRGLMALLYLVLCCALASQTIYAKGNLSTHAAYTSVSYAKVKAEEEAALDLNPRTVPIDG